MRHAWELHMSDHRCEVRGCDNFADWAVVAPRGKTMKRVCTSCRDELMGAHGWNLIWNFGDVPDAVADDDFTNRKATDTRNSLERMLSGVPHDDPSYHDGLSKGTV